MHKKTLLSDFVVVASLVALFGCGEDTTFSPSENVHNEKVATIFELGKCDQVFKGDTVYVEDQSADYFCDGKSWKIIDSDDDLDDEEKSSSSVKSSSSSQKGSTNVDDDDDDPDLKKSSGKEGSAVVVSSESSKPESSEDIRPESSSDVKPASSADVEPSSSASDEPASSSDVKPASSADVDPASSSDAEPVSSSNVKPVSSSDVKPASSSDAESSSSAEIVSSSETIPNSSSAQPEVTKVDEVAYELDDAEACNIFSVGHVVYVQSEDEGYICTASGYEPVTIQRPYIPSSSSRVEPASSAIESSSSEPQSSSALEPTSSEMASAYITDARDGQRYKVVTIGSQVWMAENLNYVTENGFADNKIGSWCYNNQPENCNDYGRLYTWAAAMNIPDEYNMASYEDAASGGICPDGFRLPSRDDWQTLADFVARSRYTLEQYGFKFLESGHYQQLAEGGNAKGFNYGPNSTPTAGMEFWSSTQDRDTEAYHWQSFSANTIFESIKLKIHAYSVRCVKESVPPCTEEKSGEFTVTNDDIMICKLKGDDFKWVYADSTEQWDYHFGRCSIQLMDHYNEREGYIYICKRRYQGSSTFLTVTYKWEKAQGSDLYGYALDDFSCKDKVVKSTSFSVTQPLLPHEVGEEFFYCDEGEWRIATTLEYDTYGQTCVEDLIIPGIKNKNRYYYCEDAKWREATTIEYDTYGQECADGRIIEGNVNRSTYYYCDSASWRLATSFEMDTFGEECSEPRAIRGSVNTDRFYICDGEKWSASTKKAADTYTHTCEQGAVITGNVTGDEYKCINGDWYGYECDGQLCEVVFVVPDGQIPNDEIELEADGCMAVSGTWTSQYYLPKIKVSCSLAGSDVHLTLTNGENVVTKSGDYGVSNVQIEAGPTVVGSFYYGNICATFTGGEKLRCRLAQ